jgi:transposase InsO family protein
MAAENPTWGAPRIHGELRMLGIEVSERTVSRYLPRHRPLPGALERWIQFLRNHSDTIAGMDFFTVPTVTFRVLYVWFAIDHASRRILHFDVTDHPAAVWVAQQLREAFPHDSGARHLIFDRDAIFGDHVISVASALGLRPTRTAYRSPWQNGLAERWIGSARRELLDHVVVFNAICGDSLESLLPTTTTIERTTRLRRKLRAVALPLVSREPRPAVAARRRLGGLHHRYDWAV